MILHRGLSIRSLDDTHTSMISNVIIVFSISKFKVKVECSRHISLVYVGTEQTEANAVHSSLMVMRKISHVGAKV